MEPEVTPYDRTLGILQGLNDLLEQFEEHQHDRKLLSQITTTFEWIAANLDKAVVTQMVVEEGLSCADAIVELLDTQLAYGYN